MAPPRNIKTYGRGNRSLVNNSVDAFNLLFERNRAKRVICKKRKPRYVINELPSRIGCESALANDSFEISIDDKFDKLVRQYKHTQKNSVKESSFVSKSSPIQTRSQRKLNDSSSLGNGDTSSFNTSHLKRLKNGKSSTKQFRKRKFKTSDGSNLIKINCTSSFNESHLSRLKEPSDERIEESLEIEKVTKKKHNFSSLSYITVPKLQDDSKIEHSFSTSKEEASFNCSKLGASMNNFTKHFQKSIIPYSSTPIKPLLGQSPPSKTKSMLKQKSEYDFEFKKPNFSSNCIEYNSPNKRKSYITLRRRKVVKIPVTIMTTSLESFENYEEEQQPYRTISLDTFNSFEKLHSSDNFVTKRKASSNSRSFEQNIEVDKYDCKDLVVKISKLPLSVVESKLNDYQAPIESLNDENVTEKSLNDFENFYIKSFSLLESKSVNIDDDEDNWLCSSNVEINPVNINDNFEKFYEKSFSFLECKNEIKDENEDNSRSSSNVEINPVNIYDNFENFYATRFSLFESENVDDEDEGTTQSGSNREINKNVESKELKINISIRNLEPTNHEVIDLDTDIEDIVDCEDSLNKSYDVNEVKDIEGCTENKDSETEIGNSVCVDSSNYECSETGDSELISEIVEVEKVDSDKTCNNINAVHCVANESNEEDDKSVKIINKNLRVNITKRSLKVSSKKNVNKKVNRKRKTSKRRTSKFYHFEHQTADSEIINAENVSFIKHQTADCDISNPEETDLKTPLDREPREENVIKTPFEHQTADSEILNSKENVFKPPFEHQTADCQVEEPKENVFKIHNSSFKNIPLKSGKGYKRSMSILRKSLFLGFSSEDHRNSNLAITSPKDKAGRFSSRPQFNKRLTVRLLPVQPISELQNATKLTDLVEYAINSSYIPDELIEDSLEDSLKCLSINQRYSFNKRSALDQIPITAKDIVLRKCGQTDPLPFSECYPDNVLHHCHKIGEGVYGEVFLLRNPKGGTSVIKIVPVEGDVVVNGERQKKFDEVVSEIIVTMELSNLRNNARNGINAFTEVQKIQCVQGKYPEKLIFLWDEYDETRGSENDCPDVFGDDQLYIVFQMAYGGKDLESFEFSNAMQAYSMFQQVAIGLATAEEELGFEHRDLHWGNVLVSTVDSRKTTSFYLDKKLYQIPTMGVEVAIIDFTHSRIEHEGVAIFNDLGLDPELFGSEGDYQFEVYRLMQQKNRNNWKDFEPYTNLLWLHYILDKAVAALRYKNTKSKRHSDYLRKLNGLKEDILCYQSVKGFVMEKILED